MMWCVGAGSLWMAHKEWVANIDKESVTHIKWCESYKKNLGLTWSKRPLESGELLGGERSGWTPNKTKIEVKTKEKALNLWICKRWWCSKFLKAWDSLTRSAKSSHTLYYNLVCCCCWAHIDVHHVHQSTLRLLLPTHSASKLRIPKTSTPWIYIYISPSQENWMKNNQNMRVWLTTKIVLALQLFCSWCWGC